MLFDKNSHVVLILCTIHCDIIRYLLFYVLKERRIGTPSLMENPQFRLSERRKMTFNRKSFHLIELGSQLETS